MNAREIERFTFSEDAEQFARELNRTLEQIGEALDKFAFTRHDGTGKYIVCMTYGQQLPTVKHASPHNNPNHL